MKKTLEDHLAEHLERMESLRFSPYTIRQARYCVRVILRWLRESRGVDTPEKLRARDLDAWHKQLSRRTTLQGRPLKARSVNKYVEALTGFLEYLCGRGLTQRSLLESVVHVKEPRMLPGSVLTHGQMKKLLATVSTDTAEGYRLRAMFELLYSSGIRSAELLGLNVDDIDFRNATAHVLGKGRKERIVPIGRAALRFLETYVHAVRPQFLQSRGEEALFVDSAGRRLPYYTLRRQVKACAAKAKLSVDITAHSFRRSCATELLRSGANMYHVKELLGHESLATLKHYVRLTIIDLKKTHAQCHPREKDER